MADRDRKKDTDVNLDKAPPPPPSMNGPTNQLDGILGQGAAAPGMDAQQQVVSTAMQIEQLIQQLSTSLPGFAPIAPQIVNALRMGVGQGLQAISGQNPSPSPGAGVPNSPQPLQQPQQQPQQPGGMGMAA